MQLHSPSLYNCISVTKPTRICTALICKLLYERIPLTTEHTWVCNQKNTYCLNMVYTVYPPSEYHRLCNWLALTVQLHKLASQLRYAYVWSNYICVYVQLWQQTSQLVTYMHATYEKIEKPYGCILRGLSKNTGIILSVLLCTSFLLFQLKSPPKNQKFATPDQTVWPGGNTTECLAESAWYGGESPWNLYPLKHAPSTPTDETGTSKIHRRWPGSRGGRLPRKLPRTRRTSTGNPRT